MPGRDHFWNLPNTITLLRTAVVPVLAAFPYYDQDKAVSIMVAWFFILCASCDLLDGFLARRGGMVTRVGKLLDPLADKLTLAAALVALLVTGRIPSEGVWGVPGIALVIVILGRELAVTGLRGLASAGGVVVPAARAGKIKTLNQNLAIGFLLFPQGTLGLPNHEIGFWLLCLAAALTLWSGYFYFADYFRSGGAAATGGADRAGRADGAGRDGGDDTGAANM